MNFLSSLRSSNISSPHHEHQRSISRFIKKHKGECSIIVIFFCWRLALQLIAYLSTTKINISNPNPWPSGLSNGIKYFARWDSGWYLSIVQHGYFVNEYGNSSVPFFPLYPLLMKLVGYATGENYLLAGAIISHVAFLISLLFLYKLIRLDFKTITAHRAILALLVFPTSFFFISVYTESLFLLLIVTTFYAARRKQWLIAGILASCAGLTRFVGVFVPFALIFEYLHQKQFSFRNIRASILFPFAGFSGLGVFMIYLYSKFGDALIFFHAQQGFHRAFVWPWVTLQKYLESIFHPFAQTTLSGIGTMSELMVTRSFELVILLLFLFFLIIAAKKLRISYTIFAFLALVSTLFSGTFQSIERYVLVLFPCFMIIALLRKYRWFFYSYIIVAALLLSFNTILFVNWYWAG